MNICFFYVQQVAAGPELELSPLAYVQRCCQQEFWSEVLSPLCADTNPLILCLRLVPPPPPPDPHPLFFCLQC